MQENKRLLKAYKDLIKKAESRGNEWDTVEEYEMKVAQIEFHIALVEEVAGIARFIGYVHDELESMRGNENDDR